jgi:cell division protein FtsI/penicillin-binding protein 2
MGSHAKANRRFGAFLALMFLLVGLLGLRLVDFQVVQAAEIRAESMERRAVNSTMTALRG